MNDQRPMIEGNRSWPDMPPKDLVLRLADALRYEGCGMEYLWDEISGWLRANKVEVTEQVLSNPIVPQIRAVGGTSFQPISQVGTGMDVTRLVYTSSHRGIKTGELDQILTKSRANNVRDLITGALIISESTFVQLLEGSRTAIGKCFMRIMKDQRHNEIQVISCGDVGQRLFQEWNMHRIETWKVKQEILSRYFVKGQFNPGLMSEFAIEDLCRTLSAGLWQAEAA